MSPGMTMKAKSLSAEEMGRSNELLLKEVLIARKASAITAKLVVEQFRKWRRSTKI